MLFLVVFVGAIVIGFSAYFWAEIEDWKAKDERQKEEDRRWKGARTEREE